MYLNRNTRSFTCLVIVLSTFGLGANSGFASDQSCAQLFSNQPVNNQPSTELSATTKLNEALSRIGQTQIPVRPLTSGPDQLRLPRGRAERRARKAAANVLVWTHLRLAHPFVLDKVLAIYREALQGEEALLQPTKQIRNIQELAYKRWGNGPAYLPTDSLNRLVEEVTTKLSDPNDLIALISREQKQGWLFKLRGKAYTDILKRHPELVKNELRHLLFFLVPRIHQHLGTLKIAGTSGDKAQLAFYSNRDAEPADFILDNIPAMFNAFMLTFITTGLMTGDLYLSVPATLALTVYNGFIRYTTWREAPAFMTARRGIGWGILRKGWQRGSFLKKALNKDFIASQLSSIQNRVNHIQESFPQLENLSNQRHTYIDITSNILGASHLLTGLMSEVSRATQNLSSKVNTLNKDCSKLMEQGEKKSSKKMVACRTAIDETYQELQSLMDATYSAIPQAAYISEVRKEMSESMQTSNTTQDLQGASTHIDQNLELISSQLNALLESFEQTNGFVGDLDAQLSAALLIESDRRLQKP